MSGDDQEARRLARAAGLTRIDPEQMASVVASARKLVAELPKDLHWSEESAHVFRLPVSREAKA